VCVIVNRYKGKGYSAAVEICTSSDQVTEFCRNICRRLDCCPNLISPRSFNGDCPDSCSRLSKTKYSKSTASEAKSYLFVKLSVCKTYLTSPNLLDLLLYYILYLNNNRKEQKQFYSFTVSVWYSSCLSLIYLCVSCLSFSIDDKHTTSMCGVFINYVHVLFVYKLSTCHVFINYVCDVCISILWLCHLFIRYVYVMWISVMYMSCGYQ